METVETHSLVINITESNGKYGCNLTNGYGEILLEIPPTHPSKIIAAKRAIIYLTENDLQMAIAA